MKNLLKISVITLSICTLLITGCGEKSTVIGKAPPERVSAFVPIFAEEMARYSKSAHLCWPDNAVVGKSVVMEDVDTNSFWLIGPDGLVTELAEEDVEEMGISRREMPDDFSFYEDGMYISVSDQSVKDKYGWDKPHVGSYDSILWLIHEGFHKWEQDGKWDKSGPESEFNPDREEFFLDIPARAKRNQLQQQLMRAVAEPGSTGLILDALATFEDYKIQNADDYQSALYYDRIEGTAQYFEVVSSLYIFYPEPIKDTKDLERAFAHLATHEDSYIKLGVISESYSIGLFACMLLDGLVGDWKERIMRESYITPLEILSSYYENEILPEPKQPTEDEIESVTEDVREKVRFLIERQTPILTGIKQGLDDLSEEERVVYEMFFNEMLQKFKDMITILPEDEQKEQEDFIREISATK